jgi:hypothetical protein
VMVMRSRRTAMFQKRGSGWVACRFRSMRRGAYVLDARACSSLHSSP